MKIELSLSPLKKDLQTISKGIQTFNQSHLPDDIVFENDQPFAVFARDKNGNIHGGLRATAFWNYCIIELLWLAESARGKGIGKNLTAKAEQFALEQGFGHIRVETLDFQAKSFYEKQNYKVFGELPDHPKGHTTYCLVKALTKY